MCVFGDSYGALGPLRKGYDFPARSNLSPLVLSISVLNSTGKVRVWVHQVLIILWHSGERLPSSSQAKWFMKSRGLLRSWEAGVMRS